MMVGASICAISLVVSSFATSLEQLLGSFSLIYGFGTCLVVSPTMTFPQDYFDKHLGIAVGLITSGSSVGTLVGNPLSQALISWNGWRNAFRFYAGACVVTVLFCSQIKPITAKKKSNIQRLRESHLKRLMQELKLWKNRVFVVWTIAISFVMFGIYVPYVLLIPYSIDAGIPPEKSCILMMMLGLFTAVGRILFGKIVSIGILNQIQMHQLSMVIFGGGIMILPLIKSYNGLLVYTTFLGLVDGCYSVLVPLLTASLVGAENAVLAWGFLIGTNSLTFMSGPPIAGAITDATGSYSASFHCAGVPVLLGASILFFIPWAQRTSTSNNIIEVIREGPPSNETFTSINDLSDDSGLIDASLNTELKSIAQPSPRSAGVSVSTQTIASCQCLKFRQMDNFCQTDNSCQTCRRRHQPTEVDDALSQLHHNADVLSRMLDEETRNKLVIKDEEYLETEKRQQTNNIMITSASQTQPSSYTSDANKTDRSCGCSSKGSSYAQTTPSHQDHLRGTDSINSNQYTDVFCHPDYGNDSNPVHQITSQLSHVVTSLSRDSKTSVGVTDQASKSTFSSTGNDSQFDIVIRSQVEKIRDSLQGPSLYRDDNEENDEVLADDTCIHPSHEVSAANTTQNDMPAIEPVSVEDVNIISDASTADGSATKLLNLADLGQFSSSVNNAVQTEKPAMHSGSSGFLTARTLARITSDNDHRPDNHSHTLEPPANFASQTDRYNSEDLPYANGESHGLCAEGQPTSIEQLNCDSFVFVNDVTTHEQNTERHTCVQNVTSDMGPCSNAMQSDSVVCHTSGSVEQEMHVTNAISEIDVFTHLFTDE